VILAALSWFTRRSNCKEEDPIQIPAGSGDESRSPFGGFDLEAVIEIGHVMLAQEVIGYLQGSDSPAAATPAADGPARRQNCVYFFLAPVVSRPESSECPAPAAPVQPE